MLDSCALSVVLEYLKVVTNSVCILQPQKSRKTKQSKESEVNKEDKTESSKQERRKRIKEMGQVVR